LKRRTDAWGYAGDLLRCIESEHAIELHKWFSLSPDEQDRRWMIEFRMKEAAFLELLALVTQHLEPNVPRNQSTQRTYTVKEKLLVTLNFLAHCPTLRQMGTKWDMPHCSIAELCLHPTVRVLRYIFLQQTGTKTSAGPRRKILSIFLKIRVMKGFRDAYGLPGCLGAIDGSLIPLRKPTTAQANQDADLYYSYNGGIASLLLAVCDADLQFTYVSAGAPACVGDAGLFSRTLLKQNMDEDLMRTSNAPLYLEDETVANIWPYLAGDSAFPLGQHLMKVIEPPPEAGSAESKLNKRLQPTANSQKPVLCAYA
jgi:hypothetical protein